MKTTYIGIVLFGGLLYAWPTSVQAAVCVFENTSLTPPMICIDDLTEVECREDYEFETDGDSFESDGYTFNYDGSIEDCATYEASLAPAPPTPPAPTPPPASPPASTPPAPSDQVCRCEYSITIPECFPDDGSAGLNYNNTSGDYSTGVEYPLDGSRNLSVIHDGVAAYTQISCGNPPGYNASTANNREKRNADARAARLATVRSTYTSKWQGNSDPITTQNCTDRDAFSGSDGIRIQVSCSIRAADGSTVAPPPDLSNQPDPYEETPFELPDASVLNKLSASTPQQLIGNLLRAITGVFGSIALVMVIYGGLTMMTARAKSDQIKKGANIVLWASIGLVTLMASYAMVQFIISSVS